MSGKILKAIRNAMVGMMNRLRMVMSLRPRLAAGEAGASVRNTAVLLLGPEPSSTGPFGRRAEPHWPSVTPPAPRPPGALVLLERSLPVVGQAVQRFLGGPLVAGDVRMDALVHLLEELGVLGRRPEVLHHQHALVERLVVRRGLAEFLRRQNLLVAGVPAQIGPALLNVVADEPLEELERLIALLGVGHHGDALAAERGEARLPARPGRIREEARA